MQRAIPWVRVVGLMGNSPVAWLMLPQGVVNAVECLTTTMLSDHSDRLGRATPLNAADTARLRGILADHFTFEELKSELCFPLEIAYEEFPQASVGVGRSVFATQLIQACVRSGRLHELLDLIQTARPHIQLGLNIAEFAPDLLHDEVRSRYLERIIRGHNYLPLQGFPIHSFMSLSLESIIVLPTLDHPAKRAGSVTLSAMLGSHRRVLLIGGLGTGKTMLIKYLALRYARALLENTPAVYDGDGNALDTPRLPIVVQIARFASAITSGRVHTLMEFLQFEYESISSAPDEIAHLLADALAAGSAVLLLDGLDELAGSAANGYPILTEIEHFLTDIDGRNRVIATSRPTGYQPISLDFTGLILHAFDRRQAHRLLKQWGAALPNQSRAIQTGLTKLAGEVKCHPGIRQLSTNPLLLTALILLCVNDQALPQQRLILYQSITRQLLTGWAHNLASPPGNGPNGLSETEMERLLGELAYWMRCGPSGDTAHEAAIRACLIGALAACRDLPPNHVRLHEAVTPFFERLRYRAGLLMATDAQHYRFALTPVQDYFAALHLLGLPNLDQFVATHCQEARWRTVIAFAIGQLSALDPRQTVQLIQNRLVTNPRLPQVEEISLALHCLGECVHDIDNVDSDFIAELARQSVQTYLLLSNSGDAKSMKRRIEAEFVRLRGSPIGQIISALLAMSLADANPALRVRSAEGLAVLGNAEPAILTGLVTALRDESPGVRRAAAKALGKLGINEPVVIQALLYGLNDPEPDMRETTVRSLGAIGEPGDALMTKLLPFLGDKALREHVINALISIYQTDPDLVTMAFSALQSSALVEGAQLLILRLGQLSERSVKPGLLDLLGDPAPQMRKWAIRMIAHFGWVDSLSVQALVPVLWDRKLRGLAEDVLIKLGLDHQGHPGSLENIRQALRPIIEASPDRYALKAAQAILARIG